MIGLIFGDTDFPKEILKTIKKKKIKYLIVDLSKGKKFKKDKKSYSVSIGQFGKIINILKENKCKKILFAGKVNKPKFSKLKLDFNETDGEHIFVKSNLKKRKVYIKDIKWIEALGDYVKVVTEENSLVVLSTMKAFEKELPEDKFLRIHKSYIVNLDKIDRFNSKNVEVGAYEIPLSRNKKTQLVDALNNM